MSVNGKIIMTLERLKFLADTFPAMTIKDLYDLILINRHESSVK
ncbi:hypothetical protein [Terrisporobacter mayombei]|nr:hypothetical protein [Terrisporobacter mayombei]